jgi:chromosome partitioning protein
MHIVTFSNLKGGSAKTTSTLAVAAELARRGRAVLAVDLDPQATLTTSAGLEPGPAAASLLSGEGSPEDALARVVDASGDAALPTGGALHVLPADRRLLRLERTAPVQLSRRLLALLDLVEGDYDVAVVDTPPQASALVTAALASTDLVLVPVASGRGALDGLGDVVELTERFGTAPVTGAFVTRVNTSSLHDRELVEYVASQVSGPDGTPALRAFVRETVRVREAEMARVPVPFYAPSSTAAQDYAALVDEVEVLIERHNG